jgi:hypothetical protein
VISWFSQSFAVSHATCTAYSEVPAPCDLWGDGDNPDADHCCADDKVPAWKALKDKRRADAAAAAATGGAAAGAAAGGARQQPFNMDGPPPDDGDDSEEDDPDHGGARRGPEAGLYKLNPV